MTLYYKVYEQGKNVHDIDCDLGSFMMEVLSDARNLYVALVRHQLNITVTPKAALYISEIAIGKRNNVNE
ncbi:unnamed protein product [Larinioides sclopetarius]|uniref:Uncharacterized protein n=1 Tax=Larinioides sclopetarius TaxID=280406 RepID=A0AAV2A0B1_9ARAC